MGGHSWKLCAVGELGYTQLGVGVAIVAVYVAVSVSQASIGGATDAGDTANASAADRQRGGLGTTAVADVQAAGVIEGVTDLTCTDNTRRRGIAVAGQRGGVARHVRECDAVG